ncbi:hypothetical protein V1460_25450 [Streptomyces sp. SCSIO 30461]|uniref:DUF7739 domain-containing protein n=1 Tax=Streptomyces sp. SCSIO 30461 TaxID=3118085 RepID=UPI0030D5684D
MRELGEYVRGILPAADRQPLARLLETDGEADRHIDSDQAALLAVLLRRTAAAKGLKKKYAEIGRPARYRGRQFRR